MVCARCAASVSAMTEPPVAMTNIWMPCARATSRDAPGLGQPAHTVELDSEDIGNAFPGDAAGILQGDQALVDADGRCRHNTDLRDVVQRLARLLEGHAEIGNRVHDDARLPPRPRPVDIIQD